MNFTLVAPLVAGLPNDPPITGCALTACNINFDSGQAQIAIQIMGGPPTVGGRVFNATIPGGELTTLLGQVKAAIAAQYGVTFQ